RSPLSRARALRDADDATGFSPELWKEMAELGWVGIPFPEAYGGAGLGQAELALVLEALRRALAPAPLPATGPLGRQAPPPGGPEAQRRAWLPRVCAGEAFLALAFEERAGAGDPGLVATAASADGSGFRLDGEKAPVLDGAAAHAFVVVARSAGGPRDRDGVSLFLVPADAPGLEVERLRRVDSRGAAALRLRGARGGARALLA